MTSELLKRLVEQRANTWKQAQAHLDRVEADGVEFSGEAEETWTKLNEELSGLDKRISELDAIEKRNAEFDAVRKEYADAGDEKRAEKADETLAETMRKLASGELKEAKFTLPERRAYAGLSVGTDSAGGYTVPTDFMNKLYEYLIDTSAIRQTNVTVLQTASGDALEIPKVTGYSSASSVDEAAAITESEPTFGQVTLNAYKYGILMQVSSELLEDSAFDLSSFLARQAGRALGNKTGGLYLTGTGSDEPNGVVAAATVGVTGATGKSGAFTSDDLIDLYYSVIAPYRRDAAWLMSDASMAALRKLKDSDDRYLLPDTLTTTSPGSILGRPVVIDPNVNDPAATKVSVLFGDFSAYYIRDVSTIRFERSNEYAFNQDVVTFRALIRTDGDLIDTTGAIKSFKGGAAS